MQKESGKDPVETAPPARAALLSYMRHWSQERWAAGWLDDLEQALVSWDEETHAGTFAWLVESAGGWWAQEPGESTTSFVSGSYAELRQKAITSGWAVGRPCARKAPLSSSSTPLDQSRVATPAQSWEDIARNAWGARYKAAGFLAILVGTNAAGVWLDIDETATVLVGTGLAVFLLVPDPPLWRIPLRSRGARLSSAAGSTRRDS
jgi:hypothetical protein